MEVKHAGHALRALSNPRVLGCLRDGTCTHNYMITMVPHWRDPIDL